MPQSPGATTAEPISSVQLLSGVQLLATPWTTALQVSQPVAMHSSYWRPCLEPVRLSKRSHYSKQPTHAAPEKSACSLQPEKAATKTQHSQKSKSNSNCHEGVTQQLYPHVSIHTSCALFLHLINTHCPTLWELFFCKAEGLGPCLWRLAYGHEFGALTAVTWHQSLAENQNPASSNWLRTSEISTRKERSYYYQRWFLPEWLICMAGQMTGYQISAVSVLWLNLLTGYSRPQSLLAQSDI